MVLVATLLAFNAANASDWHKTDANSELTIYSDWDSVQKTYPFGQDKPVVSMWVKTEMVKPKAFKGFEDFPAIKTLKTKYSFQCAPRLSSDNTEWVTYDVKNNLIDSDAKPLTGDSFVSVVPDSMGESIMRTACMKQFVNELATIKLDDQSDANINRLSNLYIEFPSQFEFYRQSLEEENSK